MAVKSAIGLSYGVTYIVGASQNNLLPSIGISKGTVIVYGTQNDNTISTTGLVAGISTVLGRTPVTSSGIVSGTSVALARSPRQSIGTSNGLATVSGNASSLLRNTTGAVVGTSIVIGASDNTILPAIGISNGTSTAVTAGGILAKIKVDSPIGSFELFVTNSKVETYIEVDSPIGSFELLGAVTANAYIEVESIIGITKVYGINLANEWSLAGLPCPELSTYTYSKDQGLVSTRMESGIVRQRRRWINGRKRGTLTFPLKLTQIEDLEDFLNSKQYDWFYLNIVTGNNTTDEPELHLVRLIEDPKFVDFKAHRCTANLTVEIQ